MANRKNTFLIKRSNVAGKIPVAGDLQLGELALNTADNILYASGTTANSILPIGWDRVARTGDTVTGDFNFFGDVKISGSSLPNGYALSVTGDTNFIGDVYVTGDLTYNGDLLVTGGTVIQSGLTANTIYTDYIDFNTNYTGATLPAGRLQWDDGNGTLVLGLKGGVSNIEVGLENMALCYNDEATTLTAGTVVYVSGSQGNRPAIKRAIATGDGYSVTTLGVVSESIDSGAQGFVTTFGMVNNLNTIGYSGGTPIWLSPTDAGGYTAVKPQAPYHTVLIGYVVRVHASVGSIFVQVSNGWEIDELHDVRINGKTQGDLLTLSAYNGSDVWVNSKTLNGSYIITGDTTVGGQMKATTVSATTYYNLPTDIRVTGATYSSNTFTYTNNTGGTFDVLFNTMTGLTVTGDLTVSGNTQSWFSGNSTSDLVRITQTGSGNALVIEDSTNPDSTPFVVNTSGFVGIGVTSPTNPLHISGSTDQIKLSNGSSVWTVASKSNGDFVAVASGTRASMYFGSYGSTNSLRIGSNGAIIVNSPSDSQFNGAGNVIISNGLSASTISATTYFNLPTDITVTGGTYSSGTATFTNNTGGTFTVTGFSDGGGSVFTGGTVTGPTVFTNGLTANTISATTYYNLPTDIFVSGGTYSDGTATFTNNTGGTFTVTGIGSTGSNVGSGSTIFSGTSGSTLIFKTLTSTGSTININGSNTETVNLETNAGVKVIPIATSSTAIGTGSNDYYLNFKLPYSLTISKVDFSASVAGSDSVRIGIYRGQDLTAVLVGQSAGGSISTLNSVSIVAEVGQNLHFKAGEWMVIGVGVGGTTTNLYGMACPSNNLIAWFNTTDSAGAGFPTNPRTKSGTRTSFPSIELNTV